MKESHDHTDKKQINEYLLVTCCQRTNFINNIFI